MVILSTYFITLKYIETKGKRMVCVVSGKTSHTHLNNAEAADVKPNELRNLNQVALRISQLQQTFLMRCAQQWGLFTELFAKQFF